MHTSTFKASLAIIERHLYLFQLPFCLYTKKIPVKIVLVLKYSMFQVSMLQKMLEQEETMHEILERIHNGQDGSAISIPNFLPPKVCTYLTSCLLFA